MAGKIKKYNPGFLTDQELVDSFCVRTGELALLVEALRESTGNSNPHGIVIGPRGSGKTTLLLRVAAEVRRDPVLEAAWFPVVFPEESYGICNCGEFWLQCLQHLAQQAPRGDDEPDLRRTYEDLLTVQDDRLLGDLALAAILDFADTQGKRLVLLVENLNSLFREIGNPDVGWELRKTLQCEPRIFLLGSATSRFGEIDDSRRALYDLFQIHTLKRLDTEACVTLWRSVSERDIAPRAIRSLEILTGGSPRLLSIVAEFGSRLSFRELMDDLLDLVDDHTEYFRSHLEALGAQERRVYLALAMLWKPATAKEVSVIARLSASHCSALLKRLVDRGAVVRSGGIPRRREYYLAERMYNIYYLLRHGRGTNQIVEALVRFMTAFYSERELDDLRAQIAEATGSPAVRVGIQPATDELHSPRSVVTGITPPGEDEPPGSISPSDWGRAGRFLREITEAFEAREFERVVEVADQAFAPGSADWSLVPELKKARGLCARAAAHHHLDNWEAGIIAYGEVIATYEGTRLPALQRIVANAILDRGHLRLLVGDQDASQAAHEEVLERYSQSEAPELQPVVAGALFGAGVGLMVKGDHEKAIAAWDEVVERYIESENPEIEQSVAYALLMRGGQRGVRGDFEAEIADCNRLIDRFGAIEAAMLPTLVIMAMESKGSRLANIGRAGEALRICDEVEARTKALSVASRLVIGWKARWVRTRAHLMQGNVPAALDALRSAYAAYAPGNIPVKHWILEIVVALVVSGVPAHEIVEILAADKARSIEFVPLVVALRQLAGDEVRASTEVLEVAADVRTYIESRQASNTPVGP